MLELVCKTFSGSFPLCPPTEWARIICTPTHVQSVYKMIYYVMARSLGGGGHKRKRCFFPLICKNQQKLHMAIFFRLSTAKTKQLTNPSSIRRYLALFFEISNLKLVRVPQSASEPALGSISSLFDIFTFLSKRNILNSIKRQPILKG